MFTFTLFRIVLAQAPHTTSPPAHFILISFVVVDLVRLFLVLVKFGFGFVSTCPSLDC